VTDKGVGIYMMVPSVACQFSADSSEFQRDLKELADISQEVHDLPDSVFVSPN
jgi:hypothetical protein